MWMRITQRPEDRRLLGRETKMVASVDNEDKMYEGWWMGSREIVGGDACGERMIISRSWQMGKLTPAHIKPINHQ